MSLTPVTDRQASNKAFRVLRKRLSEGCRRCTRVIGWQGGNYEDVVFWNPREGFWHTLTVQSEGKRFWCSYGTQDPNSVKMLSITVECNPPVQGVDRRCAGAFLTDGRKTYLAHSGKIAGGRKGIGKSAFVDWHPHGNWQVVQCPDGVETEMIVIGRVDGKNLPTQMAQFVREVKSFKEATSTGKMQKDSVSAKPTFSPEFTGRKRGYRVTADIESDCNHGLVVNALAEHLEKEAFGKVGNDRARDAYVLSNGGKLRFLFEAKTDLSTSSIYQGIGQLVFHNTITPATKRFLVLPGAPNAKTRAVLAAIGICVLTYRLDGARAVFENLKEVLS